MGRTKTIDDEALLNHARNVFREGGHAASTRDVARAAGISQAVLYQRFGSKEELFFRAMAPAAPDIQTLLGPYPPRNVLTDLRRIGARLAEHFSELAPTLLHVLAAPGAHEQLIKLHQKLALHPLIHALAQRFARLREDGLVSDVDPSASARAFLAVVHAAALGELMGHGGDQQATAQLDGLLQALWQGIAPAGLPLRRRARKHSG